MVQTSGCSNPNLVNSHRIPGGLSKHLQVNFYLINISVDINIIHASASMFRTYRFTRYSAVFGSLYLSS